MGGVVFSGLVSFSSGPCSYFFTCFDDAIRESGRNKKRVTSIFVTP